VQIILEFLPIIALVAGSVSGATIFYLNVLRIRELKEKLRKHDQGAEKSGTIIYTPTTYEVARYSSKSVRALKHARSINIIIVLIAVTIFPSLFIFHSKVIPPSQNTHPPTKLQPDLTITSPMNESKVGQFIAVEGYTNRSDLFHYIAVGPQTGSVWVTDGPLLIREQGHWTGRAQLGTGNIGEGEFFLIYAVATERELPIGEVSLEEIKSASSVIMTVKVLRRKQEQMK
jgi:hypothetical protein